MLQLIYISTANRDRPIADIEQILAQSRRNNLRDGITGLLVHDGVRFLQAIEGQHDRVVATYDRIRDDVRHRAPVVLAEREVNHKQFGSWAMASEGVSVSSTAVTMPQIVDSMICGVSDPKVRALFANFVRTGTRSFS